MSRRRESALSSRRCLPVRRDSAVTRLSIQVRAATAQPINILLSSFCNGTRLSTRLWRTEERSNIVTVEHGTRLFRTLFISDVHLGARGCQAESLREFLRYHDAETIYLVGDIVDGWQLRTGRYWPQPHNDVV